MGTDPFGRAIRHHYLGTRDEPLIDRDWVLIGTAHGIDTGLYTGEESDKLGKFLAGSRNQQRPPRATSDRPLYGSLSEIG